jgi:uncharacterized damage-inducible protein DinB
MRVIEASEHILNQLITQIEKLNAEQYAKPLELFSGSSLGQHFRHIIELYECFFNQYQCGEVDYGKRNRDINLETSPKAAIQKIELFIELLSELDIKTPLKLQSIFAGQVDEESTEISTNVERELLYNIEHTIHHLAVIKIGLKHCYSEVNVVENLGIAPATLQFRSQTV